MRKFLVSMLLASAVASPALAAPRDAAERQTAREQARSDRQSTREDRHSTRGEPQTTRDDRTARAGERTQLRDQRTPLAQAPVANPRSAQRAPMAQPPANFQRDARQRATERQTDVSTGAAQRTDRTDRQTQSAQRVNDRQVVRDTRLGSRQATIEQIRDQTRQIREARQAARAARPPVISRVPQPNTQPPLPTAYRPTPAPQWNTNWRSSSRYNWSNYRRHHNWLFNLGFYYDPFGWGYNPYQIGWRMWPSYFNNNYWLNDPWQYRLPYAPPGTRWIRYYDDAVLVDMWSGQVVDVIYDFFW
ncbi:MAG: RcnB family protein [Sphingomonas sp.]|nr:RcnB family protein [Sphingomonas sp.]